MLLYLICGFSLSLKPVHADYYDPNTDYTKLVDAMKQIEDLSAQVKELWQKVDAETTRADFAEARAELAEARAELAETACDDTSDFGPEDNHMVGRPPANYSYDSSWPLRTPCNFTRECIDQTTARPVFCVVEEEAYRDADHVGFCESPCRAFYPADGQHDTEQSLTAVLVVVVLAVVLLLLAVVFLYDPQTGFSFYIV